MNNLDEINHKLFAAFRVNKRTLSDLDQTIPLLCCEMDYDFCHRLLKYPDVQLFFTVKLAKVENVNSYNFFLVGDIHIPSFAKM